MFEWNLFVSFGIQILTQTEPFLLFVKSLLFNELLRFVWHSIIFGMNVSTVCNNGDVFVFEQEHEQKQEHEHVHINMNKNMDMNMYKISENTVNVHVHLHVPVHTYT